jgi:hypothetical protein
MSVVIEWKGRKAKIDGLEWSSRSPWLKALIDSVMVDFLPIGSMADLDFEAAAYVADRIDATVIDRDDLLHVENRIY